MRAWASVLYINYTRQLLELRLVFIGTYNNTQKWVRLANVNYISSPHIIVPCRELVGVTYEFRASLKRNTTQSIR